MKSAPARAKFADSSSDDPSTPCTSDAAAAGEALSVSVWFAVDELCYSHPGALFCRSCCCCCEDDFSCRDHMVQFIGLNAFRSLPKTHAWSRLLTSNCTSSRVTIEWLCKCRSRLTLNPDVFTWLRWLPTLLHWVWGSSLENVHVQLVSAPFLFLFLCWHVASPHCHRLLNWTFTLFHLLPYWKWKLYSIKNKQQASDHVLQAH